MNGNGGNHLRRYSSDDDDEEVGVVRHPYIGKRVRIHKGPHKGVSGRILEVNHDRWTIDHPILSGQAIHSDMCGWIDKVGEEELARYYALLNKNMSNGITAGSTASTHASKSPENGWKQSHKRKRSPGSSRGSPAHMSSGAISDGSNAIDASESLLLSERLAKIGDTTKNPSRVDYKQDRHLSRSALPPVLLSANHRLPSAVAHLPADVKVDVFNRKTGKIMSGDEAVSVSELPDVLRYHAEYEPIIPPAQPSDATPNVATSFREGRSSANARINAEVIPQIRRQNSSYHGRSVVVTNGPYRGMIGKIQGSVPGGWYLVQGIFRDNDADLPLAISPENLELLPESSDTDESNQHSETKEPAHSDGPNEKDGVDIVTEFHGFLSEHFRVPIRCLKLRIEALKEEKKDLRSQLLLLQGGSNEEAVDSTSLAKKEEIRRLLLRAHKVRACLFKAENDLYEQIQSAGTTRIHVQQCFDVAEEEENNHL